MAGLDPTLGFAVLSLPVLASVLAAPLFRMLGARAAAVLALAPLAGFAILLSALPAVSGGAAILWGLDWIPSLGIRFAFRLDGLSLAFALLVTGIGALVVLYSGAYLKGQEGQGRFLAFILLFMGAMLGLVLADDLFALFVYWEATSIASFLLIGFDHRREAARRAAIQALAITGGGGLALLAGFVLLRQATGLGSLTAVLAAGEAVRQSGAYLPVLLLILAGAFTKSAQVPFHVWLPNAMEAPTPVSAYLHSATMVKAGVYLLMRLNPSFGGTAAWETLLPLFGGATLVTGAVLALRASDLKIVLAYTTVASLGLLVMLVGVGGEAAIQAAVLYLLAHALFKGALFMAVGALDHGAGTRRIDALGGLGRAMPVTFAASLAAALSMAGVTPFLGFLAKEEVYHALGGGSARAWALLLVAFAGNAMMVAAALLVGLRPFVGARPAALAHPHEGSPALLLGPAALAFAGLAAGLLSTPFHRLLTSPLASAVAGRPVEVAIGWVPHLNLAFAISLATLLVGFAIYRSADPLRSRLDAAAARIGWGPDRGFDQGMRGLLRLSLRVTLLLQPGRLDTYILVALLALAATLGGSMLAGGALPDWPGLPRLDLVQWAIVMLALGGLAAVLTARSRLTAIVSLGVQGMAVALIYLEMGAPDLAFTQAMVETLSVVILALVMTHLDLKPADKRGWRRALPTAAVAVLLGTGLAAFLVAVTARPFDDRLQRFYETYSYALAHGRNIVNVILVDFRGIDTLGEGSVVLTAGIAVLALLRIRAKGRRRQSEAAGEVRA